MSGFFKQQGVRKSLLLPLSCVLGLGIACSLSQPSTAFAQGDGWVREGAYWKYQISDNTYAKQWFKTPNGKWWYFDKDGKLLTGTVTDKGYDYWMDSSYGLQYNTWIKNADNSWMLTDKWGCLTKGWYKTPNGKWWYFGTDHKLQVGKVTDNKGYDYWIDESSGLAYNSWLKDLQGKWMHTDKWGCLVKGWYHADNGKWWYFDKDYKLVTGKVTDKGYEYWIDYSDGLAYDAWVKTDDSWMHTDNSGCLAKGWYHTDNGKWWYFGKDNKLVTGKVTDKGYDYYLDYSKGLVYDTWVKDNDNHWMYVDSNGCLFKGMLRTPDGKLWYFGNDYKMVVGKTVVHDPKLGDLSCEFDAEKGLVSCEKLKPEEGKKPEDKKPDEGKKPEDKKPADQPTFNISDALAGVNEKTLGDLHIIETDDQTKADDKKNS